ncbi:MAG: DUF167 domain-containing protein [Candidatus Omnitrophica bacterium]|nr:DUF167 domain-containing protein [Candidatus Omnitrophota bacterium]MCF7894417.1 DUF167 domain-containing protein [Candidatus Omnitrophota bacterium]
MKLKVRVIPNAKKIRVNLSDQSAKVYLTASAQDGKANKQLKEVLADHLGIKKRNISIVGGHKSRNKTIRIDK